MKLQRFKSRTVGYKSYHKWQVNLPSKEVALLGWQEGDALTVEVRDGTMVVRKT